MRLEQYLEKHGLTLAAFGARIGVSAPAVHRYVRGDRIPARAIMQKITKVTANKVGPADFYEVSNK